jgi:hypothetical protein
MFCLKSDRTTHVYIGIPVAANEWRKYDAKNQLLFTKKLEEGLLEWKIYQDYILYRGKMLPPKKVPEEPYWGEVIYVKNWDGKFSEDWIKTTIRYLYTL